MHYKFYISILFIILLSIQQLNGQAAVVSSGGNATGDNGSVSYSVGQMFYSQHTNDTHAVTEGVQQAYEITNLGVNNLETARQISLFPNPTKDELHIQMEEVNDGMTVQVYDIKGELILSNKINTTITQINLDRMPSAMYIVVIMQNNTPLQSFKVIKN